MYIMRPLRKTRKPS